MQVRDSSLIERVARTLGHLRPRIEIDPSTGTPSITVSPGTKLQPSGLHGVFDLLEELSGKHHLAVALDEFQDIRRVQDADAVLGEIRGRVQRHRSAPYLFVGSVRHEMERIFQDPSSPFFKSLRTLEVRNLPREEFRRFLDRRFSSGKRKLPESSYEEIFTLSQENPSDVQQFCAAIWDTSREGQTIEEKGMHLALSHIFATERKGYEVQVKNLTNNQVKCLRALARMGGDRPQSKEFLKEAGISQPASVKRALDRLVDLQIVCPSSLGHKFFDPFFKQWVLTEL
jgi:hypothetical protein